MMPALYNLIRSHSVRPFYVCGWVVLLASFFYVQVQTGFAQTCQAPGDFVIDQSFGRVDEPPSVTDQTTYRYVAAACPENGEFTVATAVSGVCFNNVWHTVPEDHTPGDAGGNLLILNASTQAGSFYQQTLPGLCGDTRYEFSVWAMNLLRAGICSGPTLPNLTVRLETEAGRVLQTIDFGSLAATQTPIWRRFSTVFVLPDVAGPVVLKLINNQVAGGCGNDLALDDIQLRPCESCSTQPAYVPDAFTPNNDGRNDVLQVFMRPAESFNLRVYDRWGSLLFSSDAPTRAWDGSYAGSPCQPGEYTWILTYQLNQSPERPFVKTGRVLLLR